MKPPTFDEGGRPLSDVTNYLEQQEPLLRQELPRLNNAAEAGALTPDDMLREMGPHIKALRALTELVLDRLDRRATRKLTQLTGFMTSSLESGSSPAAPGRGRRWRCSRHGRLPRPARGGCPRAIVLR